MRLVIDDFRPDEIVEFLQEVPVDGDLVGRLREIERAADTAHVGDQLDLDKQAELDRAYREEIASHPEGANLRDRLRSVLVGDVDLVLQGKSKSYLYGTTSAVANRFLMSQIQALLGDKLQIWREAWTTPPVRTHDGYRVSFQSRPDERFDGLVVRHGPEPELPLLKNLYVQTRDRRVALRALPQLFDPTRRLLPGALDPVPESVPKVVPPAIAPTEDECLVLQRDGTSPLPEFVEIALRPGAFRTEVGALTDRALGDEPIVLDVAEAFESLSSFGAALQHVCRASIVVADVSGLDPGVLFLLGVRSAVKRGVSIAAMHPYPGLHQWNDAIPFNLRELSFQACPPRKADRDGERDWRMEDPDHPSYAIQRSILSGLSALRRDSSYQDLPGFQEVRVHRDGWAQRSAASAEMVLFLGPYDRGDRFGRLSNSISRAFKDWLEVRPQRIIDERHLGLTSRRLYEAIRYARFCVVDWTDWRPNVFLELGVRCAVSPLGALSIMVADQLETARRGESSPAKALLIDMFGPEAYGDGARVDPSSFAPLNALAKRTIERPLWPVRSRTGGVPQSFVYDVVSRAVLPDEDPFLEEVHRDLIAGVNRKFSATVTGASSELSELYASENALLVSRYTDAQRERLLAAWFYLERRYGLRALKKRSERRRAREFIEIGRRLEGLLRGRPDFVHLRKSIRERVQKVEAIHPKELG